MTALTARNIHLTDQILAVLAAESPLPVSTPALWAVLQPPCDGWPHATCRDGHVDYTAVYRILTRLAKAGEVEKWPAGEMRYCLWRRLTITEVTGP